MKQRKKQIAVVSIVLLIMTIIILSIILIIRYMPSSERMELKEYYNVGEDETAVILQNEIFDKTAVKIDGTLYMESETIVEKFNKRLYWDSNEAVLVYAMPTEVIKVEANSKEYYVDKEKVNVAYDIVKIKGDTVYIALEFVSEFSEMYYTEYHDPERILVNYKWGEYTNSDLKKKTKLRVEPDIKSPILLDLNPGDKLQIVPSNDSADHKFVKVMTEDGVIGYVNEKFVKNTYEETIESDMTPLEYTNISKDYKINLVWHQVFNQDANNNLLNMIKDAKGLTTIAPTWFRLSDEEGNISSLASETYVRRAHESGLEVWAVVTDVDSKDVSMMNVLSYTSKREKLVNELIANAIRYNLDGINVDFEKITGEGGIHFVQFIRELSIKCRNNKIVLSIDNYVPMPYSMYYDREEQGIVADYVITMAYDEHHGSSEVSGSVSSVDYVLNGTVNTMKEVPAEKTITAIPFYTRLWEEVTEDGSVKVSSKSYGMNGIDTILKDNGVEPVWDDKTKQYYAEFTKDGSTFKVWLEEEDSIDAKMKVIQEHDIAGVAIWKLGFERASIWKVIAKYLD